MIRQNPFIELSEHSSIASSTAQQLLRISMQRLYNARFRISNKTKLTT